MTLSNQMSRAFACALEYPVNLKHSSFNDAFSINFENFVDFENIVDSDQMASS